MSNAATDPRRAEPELDMTQVMQSTRRRLSESSPGRDALENAVAEAPPDDDRTVRVSWESELIASGFPRRIVEMAAHPLSGQPCFDAVRKAVHTMSTTVYLWGTNGNGKTHMGSWLLSAWHAIAMRGYYGDAQQRVSGWRPSVRWSPCNEITAALRNFSKGHFDYDREMRAYSRPTALMIDDLWPDRATEMDVANIVELVELRRNSGLRTIITSNHDARSLVALSRRFADRLGEGIVVQFTGRSHRVSNRKQEAI